MYYRAKFQMPLFKPNSLKYVRRLTAKFLTQQLSPPCTHIGITSHQYIPTINFLPIHFLLIFRTSVVLKLIFYFSFNLSK